MGLLQTVPRAQLAAVACLVLMAGSAVLVFPGADAAAPTGGIDASPQHYRWKDSTAGGCPAASRTNTGPCPVNAIAHWDELYDSSHTYGVAGFDPPTGSESPRYSTSCVPIGFTTKFNYYGTDMDCVWVSTEGYIQPVTTGTARPAPAGCGASLEVGYPCAAMPCYHPSTTCDDHPKGVIAGFYHYVSSYFCNEDYWSGAETTARGHIFARTLGTSPNQRFVVEWKGVLVNYRTPSPAGGSVCGPTWSTGAPPACSTSGSAACVRSTFEIILYEGSNNIDVLLKDAHTQVNAPGASAPTSTNNHVIGIEDPVSISTPAPGYGLGYDWSTTGSASFVGRSVRFYPDHPPKCPSPAATGTVDEDISGILSFTVSDEDGDPIASLTVTSPSAAGATVGAPSTSSTQTYYPVADFYGSDTVSYTATEGPAPLSLSTAAPCDLDVTVHPVNDAPTMATTTAPATLPVLTVGSLGNYPNFLTGVKAGPTVPLPNEFDAQTVDFIVTATPNIFSSLAFTCNTNPGCTAATFAYVASSAGNSTVCVKPHDDGGTAPPASWGGYDTGILTATTPSPVYTPVCFTVSAKAGSSGGGGGGTPTPTCTGPPTIDYTIGAGKGVSAGETLAFTETATWPSGVTGRTVVGRDWRFGDGSNTTQANPAHKFLRPGTYVIALTVTDSVGCIAFVQKTVDVGFAIGATGVGDGSGNSNPTAYAGEDQTVKERALVTLEGTANAANPQDLLYTWRQVHGRNVTLSSGSGTTVTFTALDLIDPAAPEYLVFALTATDPSSGTSSPADYVQVTILPANSRPIADAGADQTIVRGHDVTLDASKSSDPDGTPLSFTWSQVAGPTVTLGDPKLEKVTFTTPASTTASYVDFQLVVTDGVFSSADTVRIWLQPEGATAAGFSVRQIDDTTYQFRPDVLADGYLWDFGDGTTSTEATPTHQYAQSGPYVVRLTVSQLGTLPVVTEKTVTPAGVAVPDGGNQAVAQQVAAWPWLLAAAGILAATAAAFGVLRRRNAKAPAAEAAPAPLDLSVLEPAAPQP